MFTGKFSSSCLHFILAFVLLGSLFGTRVVDQAFAAQVTPLEP
jgi:hypothetical protein